MVTNVKSLIAAADEIVPRITWTQVREILGKPDTLVIDVREAFELEIIGKVAGALHVPRGMLEFRADADSPYHDRHFDKSKTIVLYCASGGRSALAGKALKEMGYGRVYNLGAFRDWSESGGPIERVGSA
jgi:rhodanese-related sulfurtransferase